jgi:hypothetical protein
MERSWSGSRAARLDSDRLGARLEDLDESIDVDEEQAVREPEQHDRSPSSLEAVQGIIDRARSERAAMSWWSRDRAYYVGVEAAAEQVLHPDIEWVSNVNWLDRHNPAFVAGYVETTARLAPWWRWPPAPTGSGGEHPGTKPASDP